MNETTYHNTQQHMLRDVTNVSLQIEAYKKIGADTDAVPFGRIQREAVIRAKEILEQLEPLGRQKRHLEHRGEIQ